MCDPIIRISGYMPTLAATTDLLHLFGDPTRVRLLALLARHELTVAELTAIPELAQSRVSTHLGKLREAGLLRDRRNGASTLYALNDGAMPREAARALDAARAARSTTPCSRPTRARCEALRARARPGRPAGPTRWPARWSATTRPGRTWEATARGVPRPGAASATCSTPARATAPSPQLLAPRARSVTCLDRSERVLGRGARRASRACRTCASLLGDVAGDPGAATRRFDHVLLLQRPHAASPSPARALAEAARVLRPGGELVVVTLDAHAPRRRHRAPTATCTRASRPPRCARMLTRAGLEVERCEVTSRERRQPHFQRRHRLRPQARPSDTR